MISDFIINPEYLENVNTHTHTHTHIYIYTYTHIYIYIYIHTKLSTEQDACQAVSACYISE